jgi:hypothetical protein
MILRARPPHGGHGALMSEKAGAAMAARGLKVTLCISLPAARPVLWTGAPFAEPPVAARALSGSGQGKCGIANVNLKTCVGRVAQNAPPTQ